MLRLLVALLQLSASAPAGPARPPETLALIDQASALAPEFTADILLRLAGSRLIDDRKWKRELIEEAFRAGVQAPLPYRQDGQPLTDSRSARAVWDNGLEALTLEMRAVEAMLAIHPQRAVAMFEEIAFPRVPSLACQEVLTPDVSAYYRTAAVVFELGFTQVQRKREEHVAFLERLVSTVQSPAHVAPAMKLMLTARLTPAQRQALAASFVAALDQLNGTMRAFGASKTDLVPADTPELREVQVVLVPALRNYIVRQQSGAHCRGSFKIRAGGLPFASAAFDSLVKRLDPAGAVYQPISAEESKPGKEEDGLCFTSVVAVGPL